MGEKVNCNTMHKAVAKPRILIADDNVLFLKGLARIFSRSDWDVVTCSDGQEAFAEASEGRFDVILLDFQMPKMKGTEVARKIRALGGRHADVPIVGISIDDDAGLEATCLEAGMNQFVTKHSPPQVIEHAVMRWLNGEPEGA